MDLPNLTTEQKHLVTELLGLVENEVRGQMGDAIRGKRIQGNIGYAQTTAKAARERLLGAK
jgi:hypothetical protein